jgi:protein-tyrosine phosphatase
MDIYQLDDQARLFISPDIDDWSKVEERDICAIIDMDGDLDIGVPTVPNQYVYIYFPIDDVLTLPDMEKLHAVARTGALLAGSGMRVLSHCGMGHNRCALVAGLILTYMGLTGQEAVELIRSKRQGALYNKAFAEYLAAQPAMHLDAGLPMATAPAENLLRAIANQESHPTRMGAPNE